MQRLSTSRAYCLRSYTPRRTLVSTVLFTRTWENETVAQLKREAKERGLSQNGNKATLITRIREHEQKSGIDKSPQPHISSAGPSGSREASTVTTSISPGVPPAHQPDTPPPQVSNIYLPDISGPDPEPPTRIPYLPDFWASSPPAEPAESLPGMPKIIVVGGSATHHGDGPSHNLYQDHEAEAHTAEGDESENVPSGQGSFWRDMAADMGVPSSTKALDIQKAVGDSVQDDARSRSMSTGEARGVWALVGILAGSWIVGGLFKPSEPREAEAHH